MIIKFLKACQLPTLRLMSVPKKFWLWFWGLDIGEKCFINGSSRWPMFSLTQIKIGNNVIVSKNASISIPALNKTAKLEIGDDTWIGDGNRILCLDSVSIGSGCLFSDNIFIADGEHILGKGIRPTSSGIKYVMPVKIGNDCFIGRNTAILPGTTLGNNCVVGANAVVKGVFPDNCVIGGVPAVIKKILN